MYTEVDELLDSVSTEFELTHLIPELDLDVDSDVDTSKLNQKVEDLEVEIFEMRDTLDLFKELCNVLAKNDTGRQILNRAINLKALRNLEEVILPHRKTQLLEIKKMNAPQEIQDEMIDKEIKLIQKAIRQIVHRRKFEELCARSELSEETL
jgi:hypothetical protein